MSENNTGKLLTQTKEEYESDHGRMRATHLKRFLEPQGPRAFYLAEKIEAAEQEDPQPLTVSPKVDHLVMGRLFHELLLEGHAGWVLYEGKDVRSLTNSSYVDKLVEAGWVPVKVETGEFYKTSRSGHYQKGDPKTKTILTRGEVDPKPVLTAEEVLTLQQWQDGVMRSARCRAIIEGPRMPEQVIHWTETVEFACPQTGDRMEMEIPCKAAIDIYGTNAMACLKTTRMATQGGYNVQVKKLGYHLQGAFYVAGRAAIPDLGECDFHHLVMTKTPPHFHSYLWTLSRPWIRLGRREYRAALERYALCKRREELGADPMVAWPDDLEAATPYLQPEDWMLTEEGISPDSWDPGV